MFKGSSAILRFFKVTLLKLGKFEPPMTPSKKKRFYLSKIDVDVTIRDAI